MYVRNLFEVATGFLIKSGHLRKASKTNKPLNDCIHQNCDDVLGELKMRDWKTREQIGYGKPIKPKQPTHFLTLI